MLLQKRGIRQLQVKRRKLALATVAAMALDQAEKCTNLLNCPEKFQSEQAHFPDALLT
jgi:hypothetical protein